MKLCFPVEVHEGLESSVYGHFGSAPFFLVFDTLSQEMTTINNCDLYHAHGACNPLKALNGQQVDAVIVGGIGGGALVGLSRLGIRVLRSAGGTVRDNATLFHRNQLQEFTLSHTCGGHSHDGACSHVSPVKFGSRE